MKVLVNGKELPFDEVEAIADVGRVARQFVLVDISDEQNFFKGDDIEIYDDYGILFIKASIEYVEADTSDSKSEFIYAGRNKAKFIIDCYADKTTQFTQNQKMNSVLSKIATPFGIKVIGDAQLPKQDINTILIGEKIINAFMEIAESAGKIITSDAKGNLLIEFQAINKSDIVLQFGINVLERHMIDDSTKLFDEYTIVAQNNFLDKQEQQAFNKGVFGSGDFKKVRIVKNSLTTKECEQLAEIEYKKDLRKSLRYTTKIDDVHVKINTQYLIKDKALKINEHMNCKAIRLVQISRIEKKEKFTEAIFEKVAT